MSWFEDWFDSPLYEFLYAYRDEEEANQLADLIENHISPETYPEVVDVGCGRGRHSRSLAERGYSVTGFDLSPKAIEKARKIADERKLSNVRFLINDMRTPLPETFDAAVNLFTTFGYFIDEQENVKVLKSVRAMLKPNGLFLIDFMNAKKVEQELKAEEHGVHKGIEYSIRRYIQDGCVYKEIQFKGEVIDGMRTYTERVRLFDKEWFIQKLNQTGFSPLKIWGDYSGKPFDEANSPRLIILSRREEEG